MKPNWKELYYQYNPDLEQHEFLYVGEKDGEILKASHAMPAYEPENIQQLVDWINKHLL